MIEGGWPEHPSILFLVQKLICRDELCPGESFCENVDTVLCRNCGGSWKPSNMRSIGECPHCGIRKYQKQRCDNCQATKLDEAIRDSPYGGLLYNARVIDTALQLKFNVDLGEVTPLEFSIIELITKERARHDANQAKAREAAAAAVQNSERSFDRIEG